jgi:hypothetical protein
MEKEQKPPVAVPVGEKITVHICPVDGVKFYHRGKYCSRACKQKAYRERMKENET